ncbi:MAG: hypothetical protein RLZZ398_294 [Verrucomicrobiota bacterium]|jgi:type I restriction enzyme S subunit
MPFGLPNDTVEQIRAVFARYPEVRQAILYGSRAMGTQRDGSDIDLTLTGKDLTLKILSRIETELDDLLLPYEFDLSIRRQIKNDSLLNHIERVGILFYERKLEGSETYQGAAIKKGWQTKPFEDCIELVKYTNKIQRKEFLAEGRFPIVSQEAEFINGFWDVEADVFMVSTPVVIFGDHTQVLKYVDFNFVLGADGVKILPPRDFLYPKFFFYQLQAAEFTSLGYARHYRLLKELEIKYPPLPEQRRIVGILDEAFAGLATAKANAEKNLQNARALFESHLQSVFSQRGKGWVEKRIEEWCYSVMDCVNKTAPVVEEPTPFKMIRTTNVRNGRVDVSTVRFVTEETYKIWTRRQIPQKGDVILTREAPMGEVGMLLTDDKVFLGQRLVSYRADTAKLDNHFLLFALQSGDLQGQIHAKASGSTVQHMRVPDTKSLLLAAPPLAKQREVVAQLSSLREETQRLSAIYQQKLAALEALKKSLLHQAFSGEL